ncbi:MAG: hypothetical protein MUF38_12165 [Anaerolineae bacterium]|jgi:hypothetical protein|nr:hypothetical protein [Anaerolineae bacterium]
MPKREQLFSELAAEDAYGVLVMAQLDAVPETLQLVIATTQDEAASGGLRDLNRYLVRVLGVVEHRVSLGLFNSIRLIEENHPLSLRYNTPTTALFFRGTPDDPDATAMDVLQAYASTFGPWHQPPMYLNAARPLVSLLASGGDLLGEMPKPLADALEPVLQRHGLETKQFADEGVDKDEHGRSQRRKVLLLDDSYFVTLDISVELMGGR